MCLKREWTGNLIFLWTWSYNLYDLKRSMPLCHSYLNKIAFADHLTFHCAPNSSHVLFMTWTCLSWGTFDAEGTLRCVRLCGAPSGQRFTGIDGCLPDHRTVLLAQQYAVWHISDRPTTWLVIKLKQRSNTQLPLVVTMEITPFTLRPFFFYNIIWYNICCMWLRWLLAYYLAEGFQSCLSSCSYFTFLYL